MHMKTLAALAADDRSCPWRSRLWWFRRRSGECDDHAPGSAEPAVTPVAEIPALTGKDTAVTLDAGFVEALGSLKLTPAPLGTRRDQQGRRRLLPDHRRQRDLLHAGHRVPVRAGRGRPRGSGLSLTGGGKTVELTDFVVDPGKSLLTGKVTVDGEVAAESAPLFFLDGRTLKPLQTDEHRDPRGHDRQAQAGGRRPAESDLRRGRADRWLRDRHRQDRGQHRIELKRFACSSA